VDGEDDVLGNPLKELLDGRSPLVNAEILATVPDRILGEELYTLLRIVLIITDGKTATGKWYLWQACTLKGAGAMWIAGLEFDKYRKVNGKWLMSEMRLKLFIMSPYDKGWEKVRILK